MLNKKISLPSTKDALPGRQAKMSFTNNHYVKGVPLVAPYTENDSALAEIHLGLGCFWGAERKYWQMEGVVSTAVGYMAGITPNRRMKRSVQG